jgi:outer membrane protein assembly factor BamB
MHTSSFGLCAFVLFSASLTADAGTWPRFRGPNGVGTADGQNIPVEFDAQNNMLWKTPIPGIGSSSPVVWEQHVFLQTSTKEGKERLLFCLDAASGKIRWQRAFPAANVKLPQKYSSLAMASPAVDAEAVYLPIWDGKDIHMTAHNFKGDLLWTKNLGHWVSQHGPGASPIIVGDKLIFALDMDLVDVKGKAIAESRESMLLGLNKKTGDLVWETPRQGYRACYSAPLVVDRGSGLELIVTSTMSIAGYNPDNGKELWNWDWEWSKVKVVWPLRTVASPLVVNGTLIATSGDGGGDRRMVALNLAKNAGAPSYVWGNGNKLFPYVSCPLSRGDYVYFVNEKGSAGCYEAKTGKQVWYESLPDAGTNDFMASPVLIDGKIYAPSDHGDVYVFAAEPTFRLLARNTLSDCFRASPAVADGRLYLRGQNHLYCVGKNP